MLTEAGNIRQKEFFEAMGWESYLEDLEEKNNKVLTEVMDLNK